MKALVWLPLLVYLWIQVVMVGLLMFAPQRLRAVEQRWPRLVRAIERGQMVVIALMLVGMSIAVTVWILLGVPGLPARG
jgi:hypothetical protein